MGNICHCSSNEDFQVNVLKTIGLSILIGAASAVAASETDTPQALRTPLAALNAG